MSIDFPKTGLFDGYRFTDPVTANTWEWDGTLWTAVSAGVGLRIAGSVTGPAWSAPTAVKGDLWVAASAITGFPGGAVNAGDGLFFDGSQWANSGPIRGAKGEQGDPGPRGATGAAGAKGDAGISGIKGDKGDPGIKGADGRNGVNGRAATITVGSTTTLPQGADATVINRGTEIAAVLDFGIPAGLDGTGSGGSGSVPVGAVHDPIVTGIGPTETRSVRAPESPAPWYRDSVSLKMPDDCNRAVVYFHSAGTVTLNTTGVYNDGDYLSSHMYFNVSLDVADGNAIFKEGNTTSTVPWCINWYTKIEGLWWTWQDNRRVHIVEEMHFDPGATITFTRRWDYLKGGYFNFSKGAGRLVVMPYKSDDKTRITPRVGNVANIDGIPPVAAPTPSEIQKAKYSPVHVKLGATITKIIEVLAVPAQPQPTIDALHALMTRAKNVSTTAGTADELMAIVEGISTDLTPYLVLNTRFPSEPAN